VNETPHITDAWLSILTAPVRARQESNWRFRIRATRWGKTDEWFIPLGRPTVIDSGLRWKEKVVFKNDRKFQWTWHITLMCDDIEVAKFDEVITRNGEFEFKLPIPYDVTVGPTKEEA
jgi:hypothetical protein